MDRSPFTPPKSEYDVLVNNHGCNIQEMYTVEDPVAQTPPSEFLLLPSLHCLYKANVRNQEPNNNRGTSSIGFSYTKNHSNEIDPIPPVWSEVSTTNGINVIGSGLWR